MRTVPKLFRSVAVLKGHCSVENKMTGNGILVICTEIADSKELESVSGLSISQGSLNLCSCDYLKRIRIDEIKIIAVSEIGLLCGEELVVKSDLCVNTCC